MDERAKLIEAFRRAGLRWTPQREAVVEVLLHSSGHPTAEEIYRRVRRRHPTMSRATVYNTVDALSTLGQIEAIHSPSGPRRFDPNLSPHSHLRCRACGRIDDLPHRDMPGLGKLAAAVPRGFHVLGTKVEFQVLCPRCRTAGGKRRDTRKTG